MKNVGLHILVREMGRHQREARFEVTWGGQHLRPALHGQMQLIKPKRPERESDRDQEGLR